MKTAKPAYAATFLLMSVTLLVLSVHPLESKEKKGPLLNRSLYVPIDFQFCPHLKDAVLYVDDQVAGVLPAQRIFQFTYYPSLERLAPESIDLRLEGHRSDGETFLARLAVTPAGIYTANERIELELEKLLSRLRYKIDSRHDLVLLRIRCSSTCDRAAELAQTADARLPLTGEGTSDSESVPEN